MKTVLVHRPGGPEALDYADAPMPAPGEREVLIRAKAFGVGQPDKLIRSGVYKWMPPLPANPGNDVAGEIEAIGAQVTGVSVGQRVLLSARDLAQRGGCYAEYVAAPADAVHVLPENVAFEDAVCLPNYQVAWALLNNCGSSTPPRLRPHRRRSRRRRHVPRAACKTRRDEGDRNRQHAGEGRLCAEDGRR